MVQFALLLVLTSRQQGGRRQCRRDGAGLNRWPGAPSPLLRHATLVAFSRSCCIPFYWVIKTAITNENIYAFPPRLLPENPHLFNFVDVWYLIPFPRYLAEQPHRVRARRRRQRRVQRHGRLRADQAVSGHARPCSRCSCPAC